MARSKPRLLTMTFTTAAFDRSSSWQFEASSYTATPRGHPSSLARLLDTIKPGLPPWGLHVRFRRVQTYDHGLRQHGSSYGQRQQVIADRGSASGAGQRHRDRG